MHTDLRMLLELYSGDMKLRLKCALVLLPCLLMSLLTAHGQLPNPTNSGIEHIIVVMMENRSFDHFMGWVTNADGQQSGRHTPMPAAHRSPLTRWRLTFKGVGFMTQIIPMKAGAPNMTTASAMAG